MAGKTNFVTKVNNMDSFNSSRYGCSLEQLPWLKDLMSNQRSTEHDGELKKCFYASISVSCAFHF